MSDRILEARLPSFEVNGANKFILCTFRVQSDLEEKECTNTLETDSIDTSEKKTAGWVVIAALKDKPWKVK